MSMYGLSIRETHGYVGTCSHLDKWRDIGSFDLLRERKLPPAGEVQEYDPCEPWTHEAHCLVTPYEGVTPAEIMQALHDHFTKQGCAHDWDCCGCRSYSASTVEQIGGGPVWRVIIDSSRNF